jgi:hypothetical protein
VALLEPSGLHPLQIAHHNLVVHHGTRFGGAEVLYGVQVRDVDAGLVWESAGVVELLHVQTKQTHVTACDYSSNKKGRERERYENNMNSSKKENLRS